MKTKIFSLFGVNIFLFFILFFFPSTTQAANYTPIQYDYWGDGISSQTLTKDKSPYLVLSSCADNKLNAGKILTIEAGVVVKFAANEPCGMWGTVHSGLYIYGNLIVNGTKEDPVIFTSWYDDTYGGDTNGDGNATHPNPDDWRGVQLNSISGNLTIRNAIFRYGGNSGSLMSVSSQAVTPILENLEFAYSSTFGISANTSFAIHNSSFHDNNQGAITINQYYNPQIDATNNWWGDNSGPTTPSNPNGIGQKIFGNILYDPWIGKITKKDPVIIVPGILGSQEKNGVWIIDPIFHTYDNLIDTFAANGFTKNIDLFVFPYDWHQSNVLTAFQLHQKIDEIKNICNCDKVDLVAHSMGGLVSRQYIQSDYYENDVDQLIFLGTPHLGAPESYLTWEGGEMGKGIMNSLKEFVFYREAKKVGFNGIYDYVRNYVVSVKELLPIYDYLHDSGSIIMRSYPTNYPQNIFLENLSSLIDKLYNSGVQITNIVGDLGSDSTINFIRVVDSPFLPLWENGYPENYSNIIFTDKGLEKGNGDETVPLFSSEFIKEGLNVIASEHGDLPSQAKKIVLNKITEIQNPIIIDKFHFNNYKLLIIKILSPADIVVIAPDGKRIGKDFTTDQEVNEIDGSFYSGFLTDNEFITIPNPIDGEYKVQMQGTEDGGSYTLATGYFSETNSMSNDFTAHILPGQITELRVGINSSTPDQIMVHPTDYTPPVITINSPMMTDYLRSDQLPVKVTATDTESGVFSLETRFDDILINNNDQIDLFYKHLGNHTLSVTSSDYVNNISTSSVLFRVIATPSSTISDINRAYQLGWINNEDIRDSLIAKMQKVIRWENKIEWFELKFLNGKKVFKPIEKLAEKIDKILAGQFLKFLSTHLGKQINQSAYDILKEDINWLLNN